MADEGLGFKGLRFGVYECRVWPWLIKNMAVSWLFIF